MSTSESMRENEGSSHSLQGCEEQVLPGIPDEITMHHILLKLPWKAFFKLAVVNRAWLKRIRSKQVYDLGVATKSTDTLYLAMNG
jgi:hypothetical protein